MTTLTGTWTSVTLTKDETWFAAGGAMQVHCFNSVVPDAATVGASIARGDSVRFATGQTVYHRAAAGREGSGDVLVRLEVSS